MSQLTFEVQLRILFLTVFGTYVGKKCDKSDVLLSEVQAHSITILFEMFYNF